MRSRSPQLQQTVLTSVLEPIRIRERNKRLLLWGGLGIVAGGALYYILKRRRR